MKSQQPSLRPLNVPSRSAYFSVLQQPSKRDALERGGLADNSHESISEIRARIGTSVQCNSVPGTDHLCSDTILNKWHLS